MTNRVFARCLSRAKIIFACDSHESGFRTFSDDTRMGWSGWRIRRACASTRAARLPRIMVQKIDRLAAFRDGGGSVLPASRVASNAAPRRGISTPHLPRWTGHIRGSTPRSRCPRARRANRSSAARLIIFGHAPALTPQENADWGKVDVEQAPADYAFGNGMLAKVFATAMSGHPGSQATRRPQADWHLAAAPRYSRQGQRRRAPWHRCRASPRSSLRRCVAASSPRSIRRRQWRSRVLKR